MRFKVYNEVFEKLPDLYFSVVVGYQINNNQNIPEIYNFFFHFFTFHFYDIRHYNFTNCKTLSLLLSEVPHHLFDTFYFNSKCNYPIFFNPSFIS